MKLFKILWAGAVVLCMSTSCAKLEFKQLSTETEFVAPSLTAPGSINLTASAVAAQEPVVFSWTVASFGQPAEILYNINATYSGKSTVLLARLTGKEYSLTADELFEKLLALGVPQGKAVNIVLSVDCSLGSNFTTLKSADKSVSAYLE